MRSIAFIGGVVVATAIGLAAQSAVAGDWALSFSTPNGTRQAVATFKVDGETLTGTLTGELGEMALKGTVKGNVFECSLEAQTQGGTISVTLKGEVDGDNVKGTMDYGRGSGEFTGKRKFKVQSSKFKVQS